MSPIQYTNVRPTSPLLTDLAVARATNLNGRYSANKLFPIKQVPEIRGKYIKRKIADNFKRRDVSFPLYGSLKFGGRDRDEVEFSLFLAGFMDPYDKRLPLELSPGSRQIEAMDACLEPIYMDLEFRAKEYASDTGNYLSSHYLTLVALNGTQFDQPTTSDPDKVFNDALEAITLTTDGPIRRASARKKVWDALARHPKVKDRVRGFTGSDPAHFTALAIAKAYDFTDAVVLDSVYDSSALGSTSPTLTRIWGNDMYFQCLDENPGETTLGGALCFSRRPNLVESGEKEDDFTIETYVQAEYDVRFVNEYANYVVKDAISG